MRARPGLRFPDSGLRLPLAFKVLGVFALVGGHDKCASWCPRPGLHEPRLTLSTRDEQLLSGAINLSDITFDLSATVSSAVDAPVVVAAVEPGLRAVAPNPFRGSTEIRFALNQPGRVELRLYDVAGRRVRDLVSGVQAAGERTVTWDGRDEAGRLLAPGIYFARFQSEQVTETRKIVRVR